ncbi:MAG: 5'-methylthioadenosine/adenosylhomocysteine nucleosidase [Duncaniella sp.]|nr:5'-methylthioadenosine/adenosylhomocysteine nucleosidase [Duncaniella sp.]
MSIGIIVAMSKELRLILPLVEGLHEVTHGTTLLYEGSVGANRVAIMECGIGKVNAAMGATLMIEHYHPDLIVSSGVGASASGDVAVMDTVIATGVVHHDFWCIGEDWGRVPGSPRVLPAVTFAEIIPEGEGVKHGLIASGDLFISNRAEVDRILGHFPEAKAVDMESAAIAQVCASFGVPFFGMRVISDSPWASHDNSRQYDDFWEDAPRHSFNLVKKLLTSL